MKVICVKKGKWRGNISTVIYFDGPKYGEECTVIGKGEDPRGLAVYYLKEWPDEGGWAQERFLPLSDIDETEMVRNYQIEKV